MDFFWRTVLVDLPCAHAHFVTARDWLLIRIPRRQW